MVGLGVGVHLTRSRPFSLPVPLPPNFAAPVPLRAIVVRFNKDFAAGVKFPAASAFRGMHVGGCIDRLLSPWPSGVARPTRGVLPSDLMPNSPALARKLFDALLDNLCDINSRGVIAGRWKGVLGCEAAGSSD
jgi:hypothetical protein